MKVAAIYAIAILLCIILLSCNKSGCDDCTAQKQEFCRILKENNCNSAAMTNYIDQLTTGCGKDEADAFIRKSTGECTSGTLICPDCN